MDKTPKKKTNAPHRGRAVYVRIEGKRVKSTPRMARILRAARKAFKGLEL